jgi:peptidyl-prolyl cis-trans isomerase C
MGACSANPHAVPSKPLPEIRVNGTKIDESVYANELQYHQASAFESVVHKAGQALVIRQLLLDQAKSKGFDVEQDEENAISELLKAEITYEDPTEDTCQRYFENNRNKFMTLPLMEVDHILLAAAKDDISGRDDARKLANQLIAQLSEDVSLFAQLAAKHSMCPSNKTGGSLGQLSKGQTVPEFERQLMLLPEGLAEQPIESRYGFHVVNITRKIEGKPLEYSMVADKVKAYLVNKSSHLAIQAYIQSLVEKAEIEGINLLFSDENIVI